MGGANEHFRPLGRPEQVNATALLKPPDFGITLTVNLPDLPELTATAVGDAPIVSAEPELPPPLQLIDIFTADDIWLVIVGFPTACR